MRLTRRFEPGPCHKLTSATLEHLEPRCLMSVSATGVSSSAVAGTSKSYTLATFTTTDTKPKPADYTATVNFEDGSSANAKITAHKGGFAVVATHKYITPQTYTLPITITDKLDSTTQTVDATISISPSHTKANGFTSVKGSRSVYFQTFYGGTWRQVGNNYKDKNLTATRVSDTNDSFWSGNIVSATTIGAYSGSTEQFGYFPGTSGGSYTNLFYINGSNANATGGIGATTLPGTYRWGRTGSNGASLSSNAADNTDGRDHMVTYQLKGVSEPSDETTYVVFWEDTPGVTSDFDFNDLIVEVTLVHGGPI